MNHGSARKVWALLGTALLASALHAAEVKPAVVTVTGSGSVGIGSMTGGEIKLGLTPDEVRALQKATAKETVALLTPILARINAQIAMLQGAARDDKIALGVAEAFLATIKGKKVPTGDWSVEFGEAARNYLRLGASIEATPVTSDKIKDLVSRADTARKQARFDEADASLAEAAELATTDALSKQQQALESTRQAASLHVSRARLAFTRLQRAQGAALLEKAFDLRRSDADSETLWWLFEAGDAWWTEGNSVAAARAYSMAQIAAATGVAAHPGDTGWQHDLSISYQKIGDVQAVQGDSAAALKSFQASLAIADRLAAGDPRNTRWRRDLAASHQRIGDVQAAQGDSAAALKSFQASLAIADRLAAGDPRNTEWQRDLSVSYEKIGDIQAAQGDSAAALKSFQAGLVIADRLAAGDPRNTEWQRDLSVSYNKIGDVQAAQGDSAAALKSFRAGLVIAERLAADDPRNTEWQRDVAVSCWKLASLGAVTGPPATRRALLQRGLDILTAQRDKIQLPASNLGWIGAFEAAIQKLQ